MFAVGSLSIIQQFRMLSCPRMMFALALTMLFINMIDAKYFLIETEDKARVGTRKIGHHLQPLDKAGLSNGGDKTFYIALVLILFSHCRRSIR